MATKTQRRHADLALPNVRSQGATACLSESASCFRHVWLSRCFIKWGQDDLEAKLETEIENHLNETPTVLLITPLQIVIADERLSVCVLDCDNVYRTGSSWLMSYGKVDIW